MMLSYRGVAINLSVQDGMGKKVASYLKDARTAEIPLGGHQVLFCHMHVFLPARLKRAYI